MRSGMRVLCSITRSKVVLGVPRFPQLARRYAQSLLEYFGAVGRIAAGHAPAEVRVVQDQAQEGDALALREHRLEHEDVVEMAASGVRIVAGHDVAVGDVAAEVIEATLQRRHHRTEVHREPPGPARRVGPPRRKSWRRNPSCS